MLYNTFTKYKLQNTNTVKMKKRETKKADPIKNQMVQSTKYGNLTSILVIVESPAKCSKIESYLGDGYKCVASFGHLRQISALESIDINNNFTTKYDIISDLKKQKHIEILRTYISNASEVILATDADREGEAIAWHICMLFGLSVETTKRIIFHEITEKAIQYAITNPIRINMNLVQAQQARQILDMLVGYTITPMLWKYISKTVETSLSAGRCQTPALRLVYDNQKEINRSPGQKVYNTVGYFTNKCIPFELNKKYETEDEMVDYLTSLNKLHSEHIYSCSIPAKIFKSPPEPLTTSRIQQLASNVMQISPKETMKYCQTLYESGYITYMRTDSKKYSADFVDQVKDRIIRVYNDDKYINLNIDDLMNEQKEKKERVEAHEAIRPTNINVLDTELPENITPREKRLYKLIWTTAIESCMSPAEYYSITSTIPSLNGTKYLKTSELADFMGWKIVEHNNRSPGKCKDDEMSVKEYHYLHQLKSGSIVHFKTIKSAVTITKLKSHYSEARLVQLLEDHGIGRPSTFSTLIDKIQQREYVKKEDIKGVQVQCIDFELSGDYELVNHLNMREFGNEKGKLVLQPIGIIVMEFLLKYFDTLFNYEYTNVMENELDKISMGESTLLEICGSCVSLMTEQINNLKETGEKKCEIKIDDLHYYIIGKHGPIIKCISDKDTNECISFKPVKKNIDISKLERGEYKIEDIVETKYNNNTTRTLGKYKGEDLILKKGKFGLYATWTIEETGIAHNKSLSMFGNRPIENIEYEDVLEILNKDDIVGSVVGSVAGSVAGSIQSTNIIRHITDNISIRKGPRGNYIFYKTAKMKKPQFFGLDGFDEDVVGYDKTTFKNWITEKYKIV